MGVLKQKLICFQSPFTSRRAPFTMSWPAFLFRQPSSSDQTCPSCLDQGKWPLAKEEKDQEKMAMRSSWVSLTTFSWGREVRVILKSLYCLCPWPGRERHHRSADLFRSQEKGTPSPQRETGMKSSPCMASRIWAYLFWFWASRPAVSKITSEDPISFKVCKISWGKRRAIFCSTPPSG